MAEGGLARCDSGQRANEKRCRRSDPGNPHLCGRRVNLARGFTWTTRSARRRVDPQAGKVAAAW